MRKALKAKNDWLWILCTLLRNIGQNIILKNFNLFDSVSLEKLNSIAYKDKHLKSYLILSFLKQ